MALVIEHYRTVLEGAGIKGEIIVVDDGSTDRTSEAAEAAGAVVVRNASNKGYGFSLLRGIERASNELIAITDADETYPAEALPALIEKAKEYDMVIGRRTGKYYEGNFTKRLSRPVFRWLAEYTTGQPILDINSGLRVFRKSFVMEHRRSISTGYSFTTTVTLIAQLEGKHLLYMPIDYQKRAGDSKVRWVRDTLRALQIISEVILFYNPIKFFMLLAAVPVILATLLTVSFGLESALSGSHVVSICLAAISEYILASVFIMAMGCLGFIITAQGRRRNYS